MMFLGSEKAIDQKSVSLKNPLLWQQNLLKFFSTERDNILGMLLFTGRNHDEGLIRFREWVENIYLPVLEQNIFI